MRYRMVHRTRPCWAVGADHISCVQEFKGYVFKITGGQDKQGFPMKQVRVLNSLLPIAGAISTLQTAQGIAKFGSNSSQRSRISHSCAALISMFSVSARASWYRRITAVARKSAAGRVCLIASCHVTMQQLRSVPRLNRGFLPCTGRAGAGPRVAADEAGRHVLPRVRAPQGRAPPQVRARLHRQPGPQRAQPDHRQARCAQHVRGYPSMITGDPRVLSSSVCGRHLACGPQHAHTWPGFHCTTAV